MRVHPGIKVLLVFAAAVSVTWGSGAQRRGSKLKFDTGKWDFGTIAEADGAVVHTFTFTNTGSTAIVIEKVNSDCGCTVPEYDREPIRPKGTGSVQVRMNPAGYSGDMRKCVTVVSSDGKTQGYDMLCLTADVIPKPRDVEDDYPLALSDGLRAGSLYAGFGITGHNSVNTETIKLANTSDKSVALAVTTSSGSGLVKVSLPEVLQPGERAEGSVIYDLTDAGQIYGAVSDRIYFSINGKETTLPISANVIVVDDFSAVDAAAHARISPVFHNFRTAPAGETVSKEFTITNTGAGPLIIRDVTSRRYTTHDIVPGRTILPGESLAVTVSMVLPEGVAGTISGGITIIVNDPDRPVRDIRTVVETKK